ncbi:hypothetical protein DPV73_04535 [Leptospira mayottensis]|nr:hypothetical protein DPV73_04535 [Leptospira mayottensis]
MQKLRYLEQESHTGRICDFYSCAGMKLPGLGTVALGTVTKFRKSVYPGDVVVCAVEVKNKIQKIKVVEIKSPLDQSKRRDGWKGVMQSFSSWFELRILYTRSEVKFSR